MERHYIMPTKHNPNGFIEVITYGGRIMEVTPERFKQLQDGARAYNYVQKAIRHNQTGLLEELGVVESSRG